MNNEHIDNLLKLTIDALWRCNSPFTKDQLVEELDKDNISLKDFDIFKEIFKDILFEDNNGMYRIDISKLVNATCCN